jgi:hypothetical protein
MLPSFGPQPTNGPPAGETPPGRWTSRTLTVPPELVVPVVLTFMPQVRGGRGIVSALFEPTHLTVYAETV